MKESRGELREYSAFTNSTGSLALIDEEGEDRKLAWEVTAQVYLHITCTWLGNVHVIKEGRGKEPGKRAGELVLRCFHIR